MTDKLEKESRYARQIEPVVRTRADPQPADLLEVRAEIQSSPHLQEVFRKAGEEGWTADRLFDRLLTDLVTDREEGMADPTEAARFLADEYTQYGPAGIQLINTATGRIAAIVGEEDLYQPAPVAREGSDQLAVPLPRMNPNLESAVVTWFHDKGREANVVAALAARGHQTALLRDMGDPRLLVATKKGRRHIMESLSKIDPKTLLESAGGRAGTFLRFFRLTEEVCEDQVADLVHLSGELTSKSVMGIQDGLTVNIHHNRASTLRAAIVGGWVRRLAYGLGREISRLAECTKLDLSVVDELVPDGFWVADPDFVRPLQRKNRKAEVFAVEGAPPIHIPLDGRVLGTIRIPREFEAINQELFDRWEAVAHLSYELWFDPKLVTAYALHGVDSSVQVL